MVVLHDARQRAIGGKLVQGGSHGALAFWRPSGKTTETGKCIQARVGSRAYSLLTEEERIMRARFCVLRHCWPQLHFHCRPQRRFLEIVTLSNRADLVSGGDALLEVRLPKGDLALPGEAEAERPQRDLGIPGGARRPRPARAGHRSGAGQKRLRRRDRRASWPRSARAPRDHQPSDRRTGPVRAADHALFLRHARVSQPATATSPAPNFSGLSTAAVDAQCNIATEYKLYYRTTTAGCSFALPDPTPNVAVNATTAPNPSTPPANACFKPYDPALPPRRRTSRRRPPTTA